MDTAYFNRLVLFTTVLEIILKKEKGVNNKT